MTFCENLGAPTTPSQLWGSGGGDLRLFRNKIRIQVRSYCICVPLLMVLGLWVGGYAIQRCSAGEISEKLQRIRIEDEKLDGSPKTIVKQLNKLSKRYDLPQHAGVTIQFDAAVDGECCGTTIFRKGEPLVNWLRDICDCCGAQYKVNENNVVIELLPISEKRTPNLEASLTNGMVPICQQFRAKRGQDRYELGEQLFKLLPHSPVTWSKEVPMHHFVSFDLDHPNYKLYKRDVLNLLGEPDRNVNNQTFFYRLNKHGKLRWQLGVEFGKHDYVENPSLTGD